jgi:hypothetical protein
MADELSQSGSETLRRPMTHLNLKAIGGLMGLFVAMAALLFLPA